MSDWLEKCNQDICEAISLNMKNAWCFNEFDYDKDMLYFSWCGKKKLRFTFCFTEEYPRNSLFTKVSERESLVINTPVQTLLKELHEELMAEERKSSLDLKPNMERLISNESDQSDYVDCYSEVAESDDSYEDDFIDNKYLNLFDEEESFIHPLLLADMEQVKFIYGEKSLSHRMYHSIHEIDVDLNIPVAFLHQEVTDAWKINRDEPLIFTIHFSSSYYLDHQAPPEVKVFQKSQSEKFGIAVQLTKILQTFLSENWRKIKNSSLESAVSKSVSVPASLYQMADKHSKSTSQKESGVVEFFTLCVNSWIRRKVLVFSSKAREEKEDIKHIVEMGFSAEVARNALIISRGDVELALNFLLSNPESTLDIKDGVKLKSNASKDCDAKKPEVPARQMSQQFKRYKKKTKRQTSLVSSTTTPNLQESAPLEDLTLLPSSTVKGLNSKNVPSLENGFLVQIFRYARQRIPTLNEYCVICDEPHVFQNGAMLKPVVCSRELCVFSYQTLNVMSGAAEEIATGAEVVDLLTTMTKAACKNHRKGIIFDPYPSVVDPKKPTELALNPKSKDYSKVEQILKAIPDMSTMARLSNIELKSSLDLHNPLAYPLLQWIIRSNRSHIVKLPPHRRIASMATPHQFLLLSSPPAKEAKFQAEKRKYSSTFAFHGSSIENWHSIIREGLIVASGTQKQVNGAAHGKGIYLSPSSSVSFGYSRMGYGTYQTQKGYSEKKANTRFLTSKNITCIALCEVITSPQLKKTRDIWVASNSDHVCTRFFFVYEDGQVGDNQINTQDKKYYKEILHAVGGQNMFVFNKD